MDLVLRVLFIFSIYKFGSTETINPKHININLETLIEFDGKGKSEDKDKIKLVINKFIEAFLNKDIKLVDKNFKFEILQNNDESGNRKAHINIRNNRPKKFRTRKFGGIDKIQDNVVKPIFRMDKSTEDNIKKKTVNLKANDKRVYLKYTRRNNRYKKEKHHKNKTIQKYNNQDSEDEGLAIEYDPQYETKISDTKAIDRIFLKKINDLKKEMEEVKQYAVTLDKIADVVNVDARKYMSGDNFGGYNSSQPQINPNSLTETLNTLMEISKAVQSLNNTNAQGNVKTDDLFNARQKLIGLISQLLVQTLYNTRIDNPTNSPENNTNSLNFTNVNILDNLENNTESIRYTVSDTTHNHITDTTETTDSTTAKQETNPLIDLINAANLPNITFNNIADPVKINENNTEIGTNHTEINSNNTGVLERTIENAVDMDHTTNRFDTATDLNQPGLANVTNVYNIVKNILYNNANIASMNLANLNDLMLGTNKNSFDVKKDFT